VVGEAYSGSAPADFALARYTTGGSLDTTFGSGGTITTDFAGNPDQASAVALQRDGKIVVVGETNAFRGLGVEDFALARYNTRGSLDTSFGSAGKVTTDFAGGPDRAFGLAIQSDGKIVAAGYAGFRFALVRYSTDGSLDAGFGIGGKVTTYF